MSIAKIFDQSASYYDEWARKAIPGYEGVFRAAVDMIPYEADAKIRILDLGAGTGLFSKLVMEQFASANFVLCDVAEQMLAVARERFAQFGNQFSYVVDDFRDIADWGTFDLVISSLAVHHLANDEKRSMFGQVYRLLGDVGVFINVDQIKGETPYFEKFYWDTWLNEVRLSGASEKQIAASIERRTDYDKDALLADQLAWLREAGFSDVDCVYRVFFVGVFAAFKNSIRE